MFVSGIKQKVNSLVHPLDLQVCEVAAEQCYVADAMRLRLYSKPSAGRTFRLGANRVKPFDLSYWTCRLYY